jgi:hypothetical protein
MFRLSRCLRGETSLRIVVVGNYMVGPITAEPCRAKALPLHPRRSYFAPSATVSFRSKALITEY